jgi:hypothetical protein
MSREGRRRPDARSFYTVRISESGKSVSKMRRAFNEDFVLVAGGGRGKADGVQAGRERR